MLVLGGARGRGLPRACRSRACSRRVDGGLNVSSFNPGNIPSANGLYLGVVFTILALSGFESVAPLAEETENPRRNLPIAIIGSVLIIAIFYMLVNWGVLVGDGTTVVQKGNFTAADQIFDLARRLWGWALAACAVRGRELRRSRSRSRSRTRRRVCSSAWAGRAPCRACSAKVHPRWQDAVERDLADGRRSPSASGSDSARGSARSKPVRLHRHLPDARSGARLLDGQPRRVRYSTDENAAASSTVPALPDARSRRTLALHLGRVQERSRASTCCIPRRSTTTRSGSCWSGSSSAVIVLIYREPHRQGGLAQEGRPVRSPAARDRRRARPPSRLPYRRAHAGRRGRRRARGGHGH